MASMEFRVGHDTYRQAAKNPYSEHSRATLRDGERLSVILQDPRVHSRSFDGVDNGALFFYTWDQPPILGHVVPGFLTSYHPTEGG